ncbi:MAG: hypothetical protein M1312_00375 [Patescibacteria group bacterium]|nr:hypothetical protein [Patescibacteria group bacterium]
MFLGNNKLISSFKRLSDENSLFHAYLFTGEKNIGKFSFAKSLGNYLENGVFDLPAENRILSETLIIGKEEKEVISIDQVREIRRFLSEKPLRSRKRLVIIDDTETLSDQAGNALLKILEEPPETSLLILLSRSPEAVIRTVRSRTQTVYFSKVPKKDIAAWLEKEKGIDKDTAKKLAEMSYGKPGLAIKMHGEEKEIYSLAESFLKNPAKRSGIIRGILDDGVGVPEFLEALILLLRSKKDAESFHALRAVTETMTRTMDYNLNKRLQLETMSASM